MVKLRRRGREEGEGKDQGKERRGGVGRGRLERVVDLLMDYGWNGWYSMKEEKKKGIKRRRYGGRGYKRERDN